MAAPDPGWKDLFGYAWAVLLIPVAMVWKKADNAVQRDEFEKKTGKMLEHIEKLYENAEADRRVLSEGFQDMKDTMHEVENRLRDKIDAKPR